MIHTEPEESLRNYPTTDLIDELISRCDALVLGMRDKEYNNRNEDWFTRGVVTGDPWLCRAFVERLHNETRNTVLPHGCYGADDEEDD